MKNILVILVIILSLSLSCTEVQEPNESIITNNPWLKIFLLEYYDFNGLSFNIDTNYSIFTYKTRLSKDKYFESIHVKALKEGWKLSNHSKKTRVYMKKLFRYELDTTMSKVFISFNEKNQSILVKVE